MNTIAMPDSSKLACQNSWELNKENQPTWNEDCKKAYQFGWGGGYLSNELNNQRIFDQLEKVLEHYADVNREDSEYAKSVLDWLGKVRYSKHEEKLDS